MFEVLERIGKSMAGASGLKTALFLGLLMVLGGPLNTMMLDHPASAPTPVLEEMNVASAIAGENASFLLPGNNLASTSFTVDVPSDAPVTNIHLDIQPSVQPTQTGFVWDDNTAWTAPTAVHNGTYGSDGNLTGDGGGTLWDFNSGLQGWTVSSSTYVSRYTGSGAGSGSTGCGYNGSAGGSIKTQAQSTPEHATSPIVNLAGLSTIPLHTWIRQGSSSCGEEADSGEDLKVQYKTTSGTWTTLHTWPGSTAGGAPTQWMGTLPAAALHANTQIRFEQVRGSGTCCDFWFIDDVHLALPPSADWTSPTIGFSQSNHQTVNAGPWAPLYINAEVPAGAYLNWTVLDASTGEPIDGMSGSDGGVIPVNALDWQMYTSLQVQLMFKPSPSGEMATVYSISGDGQYSVTSTHNGAFHGWISETGGVNFIEGMDVYVGEVNDSFTSPWFTPSAALSQVTIDATVSLAQAQIRTPGNMLWTNITLPYSFNLVGHEGTFGMHQVQFISASNNSSDMWEISAFETSSLGGLQPTSPSLDFGQDGLVEWGGSDARVGSWGWQDRFENGETSIDANPGISGSSSAKAWVPVADLTSFAFTALSSQGTLDGVTLRIGNDQIASWDINGSTSLALNATQLESMSTVLASLTSTVGALGTSFAEVTFEVIGTGNVTLGGLGVPYSVSTSVDAGSDSSFVLALNAARYGLSPSNGLHQITLPFASDTPGGIRVSVEGLNSSSAVQTVSSQMLIDEPVLAPSQHWQTMNTTYNVYGSQASMARLEVSDGTTTGVWLLPFAGGSVGLGASDSIELHPEHALVVVESGVQITTSITFRIEPSWDDAEVMSVRSRLVLSNSVISIPSIHVWGAIGGQGYENDLEIKEVVFTDVGASRTLNSADYYLKAGIDIDLSVRVGFEGLDTTDAFADGDAMLSLYRGETMVANTTMLDENYWNYSDVVPFTFGTLTWRIELTSLNGSGLTEDAIFERTFHVDSVNPQVLSTSMDLYDHRTPSITQTIQIQITDQPVLPTNVQAMVWREWIDDVNSNQWPDPGEYQGLGLYVPNDLTSLIGQYTLLLDDTGGSLGQKVAVYISGTDDAGQALEKGGSNESGEHLFMYQLAIDGAPTVASGAFAYETGREPWLHPQTPYTINVDITEPNGGSDLTDVFVELASNQGSDTLPIQWDFSTGNCTTTSPHLIVNDCTMFGANGPADPYERDITLNIEFMLAWTTPDLGETRREPGVRVIDRAGQEVFKAFPEHRWRFSAAMEIPEESVSLILSQGSLLGDGARLAPNSPLEVAGGVVFSRTNAVPVFECEVNVLFAGTTYAATTYEGVWSMELRAPSQSGTLPLTWSVGCLQGQGVDATDKETSVRWIVIDGTGPEPVEVLNPRPTAILAADVHEVRVMLSEEGGLEVDSLELIWWVEEKATGDRLRNGVEPLTLVGTEISGLRLEVFGTIDLSVVTAEMLENRLELHVVVAGRDLADNEVLGIGATPAGTPVGVWEMEWLKPQFEMEQGSVEYSRVIIEVGQTSIVTAYVKNTGTLDGSVDVVFTIVNADGNRSTLRRTSAEVQQGSEVPVQVDWNPESPGLQWIEVTLENDQTLSGPSIDVRPTRAESLSERVFGNVNPIIGSVAALLFVSIIITGLLYAARMTRRKGSKAEYDWDEYSSELEDDEYEDEVAHLEATAAGAIASTADTDTNTDSEGNIVRHD